IADVRLIFSVGLKLLATSFIIAHNHPSGNSRPSNADIALTQKMNDAGKLMDIKLQDHLILVSEENEYFSFSDDGHI
ncbi:MAG: JAB domain-containing protein, partial [Puia sp.]